MKVFEGETYPELLKDVKRQFQECKGFKPEACRDVSKEIYIVAAGYKPPVPSAPRASEPGPGRQAGARGDATPGRR